MSTSLPVFDHKVSYYINSEPVKSTSSSILVAFFGLRRYPKGQKDLRLLDKLLRLQSPDNLNCLIFWIPSAKEVFFIEIDGYLSKPVDIFDNITSYIVIVRRPQIFQFRQKSARSFRTFEWNSTFISGTTEAESSTQLSKESIVRWCFLQ